MAESTKLRVMISSKCEKPFSKGENTELTDIREELAVEIESLKIAGKEMFEVWINEREDPQGGTWDSTDVCLNAVRDCDILISLYNGDAGGADEPTENGICHAELETAMARAPAKVRLIEMPLIDKAAGDQGTRDNSFQEYVAAQRLFRGRKADTIDGLKAEVRKALHDAVIKLSKAGVRDASRGKYHSGEALKWLNDSFAVRAEKMTSVVKGAVLGRTGSKGIGDHVYAELDGTEILVVPHAIPAAFSIGPAREMVGQPFLQDHKYANDIADDQGGPIHIIACHKGATENQAIKLLGFPQATVVTPPFGIFVTDDIQKIQFAFIRDCRDETSTKKGVQALFTWLRQDAEEEKLIADRAKARARILKAIADEAA